MRHDSFYELHTKTDCNWCKKAIQLCIDKKLKYAIFSYDNCKPKILNEIKEEFQWKTIPIVVAYDGTERKFIGGYTDFEEHLSLPKANTS